MIDRLELHPAKHIEWVAGLLSHPGAGVRRCLADQLLPFFLSRLWRPKCSKATKGSRIKSATVAWTSSNPSIDLVILRFKMPVAARRDDDTVP